MLDAAHAAAWHWAYAGNELNHMRAAMLLAQVHALLGNGRLALGYAQAMRTYFLGRVTPDWEIAFTHAIYAHAALVAGDSEAYRAAYEEALEAIDSIADEEDRKVVLRTFEQVPVP
jgi:hypothetical protein